MTQPPPNILAADTPQGLWNPGVLSQILAALLPLATNYRTENVYTPLHETCKLAI